MFTGPVGPVEVFVYWPEAVLGNFYWPGAIGSPLASSPGAVEAGSFVYWCLMTSYHVSVLYDTSRGIGCSNNGAQFKKCGL